MEKCPSKNDTKELINIINKRDDIIEQKDKLIEELRTMVASSKDDTPKAVSIDKSVHNTHIGDSVINITNNITVQKLYFCSRADALFVIENYREHNPDMFDDFCKQLYDYIKRDKLESVFDLTYRTFHANSKFKSGHNIKYCHQGIHKGKFLTFNAVDNYNSWFVTRIGLIVKVLCDEIVRIIALRKIDHCKPKISEQASLYSDEEHSIIGEFEYNCKKLYKESICVTYAKKIIAKYTDRDEPLPKNIASGSLKNNIPNNDTLSTKAKKDKTLKRDIIKHESDSESLECDNSDDSSDSIYTKMRKTKKINNDNPSTKEDSSSNEDTSVSEESEKSNIELDQEPKLTKEEIERNRIHEEQRQIRKAREREQELEEEKEQEMKRKCEAKGKEYMTKKERLAQEHYNNYLKEQRLKDKEK
jgi:hypothetical protein